MARRLATRKNVLFTAAWPRGGRREDAKETTWSDADGGWKSAVSADKNTVAVCLAVGGYVCMRARCDNKKSTRRFTWYDETISHSKSKKRANFHIVCCQFIQRGCGPSPSWRQAELSLASHERASVGRPVALLFDKWWSHNPGVRSPNVSRDGLQGGGGRWKHRPQDGIRRTEEWWADEQDAQKWWQHETGASANAWRARTSALLADIRLCPRCWPLTFQLSAKPAQGHH